MSREREGVVVTNALRQALEPTGFRYAEGLPGREWRIVGTLHILQQDPRAIPVVDPAGYGAGRRS